MGGIGTFTIKLADFLTNFLLAQIHAGNWSEKSQVILSWYDHQIKRPIKFVVLIRTTKQIFLWLFISWHESITKIQNLQLVRGQGFGCISLSCHLQTLKILYCDIRQWWCCWIITELEGLVKFIQPFMAHLSKAKAAKMVRELLDLFLDMEVSTGTEVLHVVSSEASPTIWSCYANLNHYHYSFLLRLIPFIVYKHRKICIAWLNCRAVFATACSVAYLLEKYIRIYRRQWLVITLISPAFRKIGCFQILCIVHYIEVQGRAVQYSTVRYSTVLCSTVQYSTGTVSRSFCVNYWPMFCDLLSLLMM